MNSVVKDLHFDTENDDRRTRGFVNKLQDWKNTKPGLYASESKGNAKGLERSKPLDIVGVCKISDVYGGHEVKGIPYGEDGLSGHCSPLTR